MLCSQVSLSFIHASLHSLCSPVAHDLFVCFFMWSQGAHTIGFAQCFTFKNRLFNFSSTGEADPTLNSSRLKSLQSLCPNNASSNTNLAPLDPVTTNRFDNVYYKNLINGSGLLQSDEALMGDLNTASMVSNYSRFPFLFSRDFGESMVKMAAIGALTGERVWEMRANCRVVN